MRALSSDMVKDKWQRRLHCFASLPSPPYLCLFLSHLYTTPQYHLTAASCFCNELCNVAHADILSRNTNRSLPVIYTISSTRPGTTRCKCILSSCTYPPSLCLTPVSRRLSRSPFASGMFGTSSFPNTATISYRYTTGSGSRRDTTT